MGSSVGSVRSVDLPDRDIRFTTTDDGVAIAYWEIGEGKPVVMLKNLSFSHAELEWSVPSIASFYMKMAERYQLIRYDPRGVGLSGEPPGGWGAATSSGAQRGMTTHEMSFDITAVVEALQLESFTLMGLSVQGPVAIEYAATHPQVSELILCDSFATVATSALAPWLTMQVTLAEANTDTGSTVMFVRFRMEASLHSGPTTKRSCDRAPTAQDDQNGGRPPTRSPISAPRPATQLENKAPKAVASVEHTCPSRLFGFVTGNRVIGRHWTVWFEKPSDERSKLAAFFHVECAANDTFELFSMGF